MSNMLSKLKQKLKVITGFATIITITILMSGTSLATDLKNLEVSTELLDGGDGIVTMTWDYTDDEGTEHYFPIETKGITITDFSVEKNGVSYETITDWDVGRSFEEKAYKAGIVDNGDNIELCWGISEYGENKYKVTYKVEGLVRSLTDYNMLFYKFVNDGLSEAPKNVKIEIYYNQKEFNFDNTRMWAFGFDGNIDIKEGHVVWESGSSLSKRNYGVVLLRLEKDFLNSNYTEEKSFEDYRVEAFKGSKYSEDDYGEGSSTYEESESRSELGVVIKRVTTALLPILFGLGIVLINHVKKNQRFGLKLKDYDQQYYRDIPYGGDPEDIYYILNKLNLKTESEVYSNYITYYFLKWIKEGVIIKDAYEGGFIMKKEKFGFKILENPQNASKGEEKFFEFLKKASGENNRLEEKEFDKWLRKNISTFESFTEKLDLDSKKTLEREQYLKIVPGKSIFSSNNEELTEKGKELAENIIKFKNFLLDFSLLNERDSMNVGLWDDLMLYAALIGVTDEVKDEFNKLYPEYFERTEIDFTAIYLARMYSTSINRSYASASSSEGFGGSTGMGGGGGSFGGGSGGGTR